MVRPILSLKALKWVLAAIVFSQLVLSIVVAHRINTLPLDLNHQELGHFSPVLWVAFFAYLFAFLFSDYLRPRSLYRHVGIVVLSFANAFLFFLCFGFIARLF